MRSVRMEGDGKGVLDLLEEAMLVLRRLPFLSWAALYLGVLPFVLLFLLYLMNLAHNPAISEQLVGYSALLAVFYVWLRVWQTVFAAQVWSARSGSSAVSWSVQSALRVIRDHLRYSALSLVGLGVSVLLVFPLAWSYALHQNLLLLVLQGFDKNDSRAGPLSRSWRQARLWPGQNHLVTLLLGLIGLFVFVNFAACLVFFPYLVKFLTGWESPFTRLGVRLLDFKMFVAALVLTYLAVMPVTRAVYVLRCFYGTSLQTGADLLSELRSTRIVPVLLVCLLVLSGSSPAWAASQAREGKGPSASTSRVEARRLDASITTVLESRKHLWQAPGNARKTDEPSFWRDFGRTVQRWVQKLAGWLDRMIEWLRPANSPRSPSGGRAVNIKDLAIVLLVVCALGLAVLVVRALLERRARPLSMTATKAGSPVDLRRSELSPEELPEDRWLDLAREMMESGQARLAVRAVYLAAIVVLGKRQLVEPTRFKSNRDYLLELRRRHRGNGMPITTFQSMIGMFEKVWYGRHEPGRADFEEMHRLLLVLRA